MKPAPFRYSRPESVEEAVDVLAGGGGEAKVLAGGQSLLPMLSMRLAAPARLVDINRIPGLDEVQVGDGEVRVGALVRHADLERHEGASSGLPLLARALRHVAHPTIRNRGTTLGSICHADPAAEMPAVLTLLGGYVLALSVRGERRVPAAEFFVAPMESQLAADELAVAVVFPIPAAGTGTSVVELARRHGDYAICGVVAAVRRDGAADEASGLASSQATFISAGEVGAVVDLGEAGTDWAAAGELAASRVEVEADIHASADYRRRLVEVLTARALAQAWDDGRPCRTAA